MVGIVAVTRFCEAGGEAFARYIDYIDRDSATRKDNLERYNLFGEYLKYMGDDNKTITDKAEKVSALFTKHSDDLDAKDKTELKKTFLEAQSNGSLMWQTVISFDNEYLRRLGLLDNSGSLDEKRMIPAARAAVSEMLSKESLDNAVFAGSIHYNTDNVHIHVATVEPVPMREKRMYLEYERDKDGRIRTRINEITGKEEKIPKLDLQGNKIYAERYKGRFKESSIKRLKSVMRAELDTSKEQTAELTGIIRGIIDRKKDENLLNNTAFSEAMISLYEDLRKSGVTYNYWRYNQNAVSGIRPKIDEISDLYIATYHQNDFSEIMAKIENLDEIYRLSYGGTSNYVENRLHGKDGLYVRLGNAIMRELRDYEKERLSQIAKVQSACTLLDPDADSYDPNKAIAVLKEACSAGNSFAANELGLYYLKAKDMNTARHYFKISSSLGNEYGSKMYRNTGVSNAIRDHLGFFSKRNFSKAVTLLRRSMYQDYMSWRNRQAYEELQREITAKGYNQTEL